MGAAGIAGTLVRWAVGGLFIYMGFSKALDPIGFLKLVREYDIVQSPFILNSIAAALPWFEIVCGILLVLGVAVRGAALVTVLMLVPFTFIVLQRAMAIHSAGTIPFCAIKFDCGCGQGEVLICRKLLENGMLLIAALGLILGVGRRFCLRWCVL